MTKRILAYFYFPFGFILYVFSAYYTGALPFRIIFILIGLVMHIVAYRILQYGPTIKQLKAAKRSLEIISSLIENGEKIIIDLSKCVIKENDYSVQADRLRSRDGAVLDAIYDSSKNITSIDVNQCVLIYNYNHNGIEEKFISPIIPRTSDDLRIKLYLVKTTSIYVDKNDRSKYYFDLNFLKREGEK